MARRGKDKSEKEHTLGILRQLKAENKHLRKQLARADKGLRKVVEATGIDEPDYSAVLPEEVPESSKCLKCGKLTMTIDMGVKSVITCMNSDCKHRRTLKK